MFLAGGLSATAAWGLSPAPGADRRVPRVAAINSVYRFRSHAYHIVGRFLDGYRRNGFHHRPPFEVARMYNHQRPENDLSADAASRGVAICSSVEESLGGADSLDVDAVLLIVEHGDYPVNERGQILYPRFELFQQIVEVFRRSGRTAPVFVDKALSYDYLLAREMVEASRKYGFGLMAGSSLPVTWRRPELEPPLGTQFREGLVSFGYDRGPAEIYFFHGLETLQCMLERRAGGETGLESVTCLEGDAVWKAADEGRWSWKLLEAALARSPSNNVGAVKANVKKPQAILLEYRDGVRGAVLNLIEQVSDFAFAGRVEGQSEPAATCFYLPQPPGARFFDPLVYNIEQFFAGKQPYPVERTLLTSTALDLAMRSLQEGGQPQRGEMLAIAYQAPESSGFFRGHYTDAP